MSAQSKDATPDPSAGTQAPEASTGPAAPKATPEVAVETESKFEAPRRWVMPRLDRLEGAASVDAPQRFTQTATYLDTLDLALLRGRHTLRRRTGGSDAGWHLKTPGDGSGRVEHRLPLGRSASIVPSELRDVVADLIGDACRTVGGNHCREPRDGQAPAWRERGALYGLCGHQRVAGRIV